MTCSRRGFLTRRTRCLLPQHCFACFFAISDPLRLLQRMAVSTSRARRKPALVCRMWGPQIASRAQTHAQNTGQPAQEHHRKPGQEERERRFREPVRRKEAVAIKVRRLNHLAGFFFFRGHFSFHRPLFFAHAFQYSFLEP